MAGAEEITQPLMNGDTSVAATLSVDEVFDLYEAGAFNPEAKAPEQTVEAPVVNPLDLDLIAVAGAAINRAKLNPRTGHRERTRDSKPGHAARLQAEEATRLAAEALGQTPVKTQPEGRSKGKPATPRWNRNAAQLALLEATEDIDFVQAA
jgi:hypothetical protein